MDAKIAERSKNFIDNIATLAKECREHGIVFIPAVTQQAKSYDVKEDTIRGVTYARESEIVREKLAREGRVGADEMYFLIHGALMKALREWAATANVPLCDAVAALDERRDVLPSGCT